MLKNKKIKKNWSDEDTKILLWAFSHYSAKTGLASVESAVLLFLSHIFIHKQDAGRNRHYPLPTLSSLPSAQRRALGLCGGPSGGCERDQRAHSRMRHRVYLCINSAKQQLKVEVPGTIEAERLKAVKFIEVRGTTSESGDILMREYTNMKDNFGRWILMQT